MSLEEFNAQSALWDTLPVKSDILIIDRQLAKVPGVRASIISELDELLKVPREEIVGIIFAHKRLQKPEYQDEDEDGQEPLDPMFLPYFGANPSPACNAILNIFHNNYVHLELIEGPKVKHCQSLKSKESCSECKESQGSDSVDPERLDESYNFISYLWKGEDIYELDSDKGKPLIIGKVSDHGEEADWIKPLVDHLKKKVANDNSSISCAIIRRIHRYTEKIEACRDRLKLLGEQLKPNLTPEGLRILQRIQRLDNIVAVTEKMLFSRKARQYRRVQYGSSDSDLESSNYEESDAKLETQECCTDVPNAQDVSDTEEARKTQPENRSKSSKKRGSKSTKGKKKSGAPVKQKDNDHDQDADSGRPCRRNLRSHKRS